MTVTGDSLGVFCSLQDRDTLVLCDPEPCHPPLQPLSEEAQPGDISFPPSVGSSAVDPRQPRKPESHLWAKMCLAFAAEVLRRKFNISPKHQIIGAAPGPTVVSQAPAAALITSGLSKGKKKKGNKSSGTLQV